MTDLNSIIGKTEYSDFFLLDFLFCFNLEVEQVYSNATIANNLNVCLCFKTENGAVSKYKDYSSRYNEISST